MTVEIPIYERYSHFFETFVHKFTETACIVTFAHFLRTFEKTQKKGNLE